MIPGKKLVVQKDRVKKAKTIKIKEGKHKYKEAITIKFTLGKKMSVPAYKIPHLW
jgi:hypothetical protein